MSLLQVLRKKTTPLCLMPNGQLLCYHYGRLIVIHKDKENKSISVPISILERLMGWNRYLFRLLRFGVRTAEVLDENHAIISIRNYLYEVDINTSKISKGWFCGAGVRPLIMTSVKDIKGFTDGVYFGGYLRNKEKNPVHIYRRLGVDQWEIAYTFPLGTINHVHNVVVDKYRQCLWVFTGDFDESAAIWKVTNNFQNVECVACNNQKYRGCVVYAIPEGLLYATDSPYANNYIYLMNPESSEVKQLHPIDGSCIYGCRWKNKFVFSSTVEWDGMGPRRWALFYKGERGSGIKDDFVHMYIGSLSDGFKEIYKEKKDRMSFLFQFGVFKFPNGINNSETLFCQPVATEENDLRLMVINEV